MKSRERKKRKIKEGRKKKDKRLNMIVVGTRGVFILFFLGTVRQVFMQYSDPVPKLNPVSL